MTKALLWILSTTLLSIAAVAQAVTDAPVNWTTYNIKAHKLSIQFPKLPIHYFQADLCNEKRIDYFIAYAEETVYTLAIIKKEQPAFALSLCKTSSKFGRETLDSRRADLEKLGVKQAVSDGKELWQISRGARLERIWIFDDLKKNRWVELSV